MPANDSEDAVRGEPSPEPAQTDAETSDDTSSETETRNGEINAETLPNREDASALTVVGIGASAGGVQALEDFFRNTPPDSNLAFVVVLHLSPEYDSHLAEILSRATTMPVQQVTNTVRIEPNMVYVIPPAQHLVMQDGYLYLTDPDQPRGRRIAIDLLFRTLAEAHHMEAVAVVLSGSGADGTLGIKQIKELGGLTIAQEPDNAEYDSMPRNAIATGQVDYVLPVSDMARQIIAYRDTSHRMKLPEEAAPSPEQISSSSRIETVVSDILAHLRGQTGHDFAHYKRATVLRRIGRRLLVNNLEDLPTYLNYLRRHPAEVNELLGDLLISVTQFSATRKPGNRWKSGSFPVCLKVRDLGMKFVSGCAVVPPEKKPIRWRSC
ncbi:MAG: hypothetical protein OHK0029_03950 [Armatimonadaceae bacterium]